MLVNLRPALYSNHVHCVNKKDLFTTFFAPLSPLPFLFVSLGACWACLGRFDLSDERFPLKHGHFLFNVIIDYITLHTIIQYITKLTHTFRINVFIPQ